MTTRTVTMHVPLACAAGPGAYALYYALGDFDRPGPNKGHALGDQGSVLAEIDTATRALVVQASEGENAWSGVGAVRDHGDVDVLLWPARRSCALSTGVGARVGTAMAPIGDGDVLVVGGTDVGAVPGAYLARLDTGEVSLVSPGLLPARTRASVTSFGAGALVAGGVDDGDGRTVLDTADVYDAAAAGFDQQNPIRLGEPRADHGAVVLGSGQTLLVGGVAADGKSVLSSLEVVDPATRTVRAENVARLAVARRDPDVLRLATGEVLVAGGFGASGQPVTALEWLAPDAASARRRPIDLVSGSARAIAPLQGGGALAVVAPPQPPPAGFQSVWVIGADGALQPARAIEGALTQPVLFGAAGGAPVLWTGDRWLRWNAWSGSFDALGALDDTPPRIADATCSPDPGLAMWLTPDSHEVTALRFDVRGIYSSLPGPLLVGDTSEMCPDRLAGGAALSFDGAVGLTLSPGATAFVSDRTYAGVTIDVDAPTGEPPVTVLRDEQGREVEVGGATCPLPSVAGVTSMHVSRSRADVLWRSDSASGTCPGALRPDARVSIGLRGTAGANRSIARNLRVARTGGP